MALDGAALLCAGSAKFRSLDEGAGVNCSRRIDGSVSRVAAKFCQISGVRKESLGTALFCGRDGGKKIRSARKLGKIYKGDAGICQVRAEAEVADGSAGPNTGIGASGSARKERDDESGNEKAQALSDSTIYPVMRVYRNDLCSLEVTGDAKAWEVVGAMAADGGFTASEELTKGRSLMTVETIIPGRSDDHSTVSTKLLAPTELVSKRAKLMWSKREAQKRGSSSGSALAIAFQSVVMQRVLAFDFRIQAAGNVRDMANLANEKETGVVAIFESRDGKILEGLAEAVCSYLLANIKDAYDRTGSGQTGISGLVPFWKRTKQVYALDKAICVSSLSDTEVWENARRILEEPTFLRDGKATRPVRTHQSWWPLSDAPSASSFLADDDLRNFSNEFVPIHKIEIDINRLQANSKGWQKSKRDHIVELQLTHAQLVDMADVLDLFYEDRSTVPVKELKSGMNLNVSQNSRSKVAKTLWTVIASALAGGILIVGLIVTSRMRGSSTSNFRISSPTSSSVSDSSFKSKWCTPKYNRQVLLPSNNDVRPEEMEALCTQVVLRMKHVFKLDGEVQSSPGRGAWLGLDITDWGRARSEEDIAGSQPSGNDDPAQLGESQLNSSPKGRRTKPPVEEVVLLYQVMLSRDGKVVGFQPGNKAAIGYWVNYPFAEDLHKGRKLGPGLIEPGLRYVEPPEQLVAIELLCRPQSDTPSIAARPLEITSSKTSEEF
ncbi:hypothetical protein R1sor_004716 [Riccia sorocarpa]|uniref:Uncharacterized protein n=1 Tax=Riccia sorocarpa TaxID=122646 RepID=A0ABD3HHH1_9MARC